jgi:flagellar basal body-associated protein FliL
LTFGFLLFELNPVFQYFFLFLISFFFLTVKKKQMSLSAGAIVGIVIGALILALALAYIIYTYWWLRHKNATNSGKINVDTYIRTSQKAAKMMAAYDDSNVPDMPEMSTTFDDDYQTSQTSQPTYESTYLTPNI